MSTAPHISVEVHSHGERGQAAPYVSVKVYGYGEGAAPHISVKCYSSREEDAGSRIVEEQDELDIKTEVTPPSPEEHDEDVELEDSTSQSVEHDDADENSISSSVKHGEDLEEVEAPSQVSVEFDEVKEEANPWKRIKHDVEMRKQAVGKTQFSVCFWDRLPIEVKLQIMRSLSHKTALKFWLVNKEAAAFIGSDASSPVLQRRCEYAIKDINMMTRPTEEAVVLMVKHRKPFMLGRMVLNLIVQDETDLGLIQKLAGIVGSQAGRIICRHIPQSDDFLADLARFPASIPVVVMLKPTVIDARPCDQSWLRNELVFSSNVRRVSLKHFHMDNSTFSIRCASLDQLAIGSCYFSGNGCDLNGIQHVSVLRFVYCYISSWAFISRLPKSIEHLELVDVMTLNGAVPLPSSLKNISISYNKMVIWPFHAPWRNPNSLQSGIAETFEIITLLALDLPEGLLALKISYDATAAFCWRITDEYVDYIFPDSIREIHIDTSSESRQQYEGHDVQRVKWIKSLKLRHPQADIQIT